MDVDEDQIEYFIVWTKDGTVKKNEIMPEYDDLTDDEIPHVDNPKIDREFISAAGTKQHIKATLKDLWNEDKIKVKCVLKLETYNSKHLKRGLENIFEAVELVSQKQTIYQSGIEFHYSRLTIKAGFSLEEVKSTANTLSESLNAQYFAFQHLVKAESRCIQKTKQKELDDQESEKLKTQLKLKQTKIRQLTKDNKDLAEKLKDLDTLGGENSDEDDGKEEEKRKNADEEKKKKKKAEEEKKKKRKEEEDEEVEIQRIAIKNLEKGKKKPGK